MTRGPDTSNQALARRDQREGAGWWVILDARGKVVQAVRTKGCHPGLMPGVESNVMRTFFVGNRPDLATDKFDKGQKRMVADAVRVEKRAEETRRAELSAMPSVRDELDDYARRLTAIEQQLEGLLNGR
jgi:hypothetical protein